MCRLELRSLPDAARLLDPPAPRPVRATGAESVSGEPGPAARGSGRLLHAALDRAADGADGDRALARHRPGRAARDAAPGSRIHGAGPGVEPGAGAGGDPEAQRRDRLAAVRHDDLLQL